MNTDGVLEKQKKRGLFLISHADACSTLRAPVSAGGVREATKVAYAHSGSQNGNYIYTLGGVK